MDDEPITASDYFQKGVELLQTQRFDKALEYINNAIARNYYGADIALVKGEILFELQRHDEALDWFSRAIELDPSVNAEATLWKGRVYFEKQHFGRALSAFNRVINSTPMPGEAYLNKGMVLCERGDFLKALDALEEARSLLGDTDDKLAEIMFWQARSLRGLGRDTEAIASLEKVLDIASDFIEAYIELGEVYRAQGLLEQACDVYKRGLKDHPHDPSLHNDYGNVMRDLGRLEESLEELNHAVSFDGPTSVAVYNRALTYERLQRWDEALQDYSSVLENNPGDVDARLRSLDLLARRDRFDEAYTEYKNFGEEERALPEVQEGVSRLLNRHVRAIEQSADVSTILQIYRQLLEIHPDFLDLDNPGKQYDTSRSRHTHLLELMGTVDESDDNVLLVPLICSILLSKLQRREEALETLSMAKTGPFPEVAYLLEADICYYDLHQPARALEAVDQALALRQEFVAALWLKVAILYEGLQDIDGAIDIYRRVLRISRDNPAVLHALAEVYLEHGQPFRALMCFRQMLALSPGDIAIQRELSQCYLALGRVGEAVSELKRLRNAYPGDLELAIDLGEAMVRAGLRLEGRALLLETIEENRGINPSIDESAHELLAEISTAQREYDEALEWLENVRDEALSTAGVIQKAVALMGAGNPEEAETYFNELVQQLGAETRDGRRARVELAKLARARKEYDDAVSLLEEALDGTPYTWRVRTLLAWVLREQGEAEAAEAQEQLIALHRDLESGIRFMFTEEYQDALDEFRRIAASYPEEADACYWLAAAQCMNSQYEGAAKSLQRAIELEPLLEARARMDAFFDEFAFTELRSNDTNDGDISLE